MNFHCYYCNMVAFNKGEHILILLRLGDSERSLQSESRFFSVLTPK